MATGGSATNGAALQAQIDGLNKQVGDVGQRMDVNFAEIKGMMMRFEERLREVEQQQLGCQPLVMARLAEVERRQAMQAEELKALERAVQALLQTNRVLQWFLGILTALLTAGLLAAAARLVEVMA